MLILGAGGHGRVVADAAVASGAWTRVIASDRDPGRCTGELLPGVALMPLDQALGLAGAVHVAIGQAAAREREVKSLPAGKLASVVHPRASVSAHAQVAPGCFIAAQAVVAPRAVLGASVIVNHGAVVDHDVEVGDYSHVAPLTALGGAARIGRAVLVGSGTNVLPGKRVRDGIVIGSGAAVVDDLAEPGVYAGVPARRIK
ncbi:NeuD/PglB/VioB family sugar acetyltransferase [Caenimonas sp. DR4.4]|uniref:NeuD/PglB/VioB family sugar acetyltransferase n=1 Tax=Caenimonas aquaedulcis TaxID=2793270 RepID=A0A931MH43_9BURK|nr:NeuD/PglB/VioB family sugar acetyltransferase [Caenimonas aquaedulcis]MBG9387860.1 NeuD/PglB/VioB family sugar acetyltransferase [Caenimonas aquaedulcis]